MASLRVLVAIAPVSLQNYVIEDFLIIREIGEDQSHHAMTQPINATRRLRTPTTHAWKFASLSCCEKGWASGPMGFRVLGHKYRDALDFLGWWGFLGLFSYRFLWDWQSHPCGQAACRKRPEIWVGIPVPGQQIWLPNTKSRRFGTRNALFPGWKWNFRKIFSIKFCSQKVSDTQCVSPGHVFKPKSKELSIKYNLHYKSVIPKFYTNFPYRFLGHRKRKKTEGKTKIIFFRRWLILEKKIKDLSIKF